jgi:hypothetical protein
MSSDEVKRLTMILAAANEELANAQIRRTPADITDKEAKVQIAIQALNNARSALEYKNATRLAKRMEEVPGILARQAALAAGRPAPYAYPDDADADPDPDLWRPLFPPAAARPDAVHREDVGAEALVGAPALQARVLAALNADAPAGAAFPDFLKFEDIVADKVSLDKYIEMMKCPICVTNIKDVRLNCGHLLCKSCVKKLIDIGTTKCPLCVQPIISIDRVFYAKYLKYKKKYLQLIPKKMF